MINYFCKKPLFECSRRLAAVAMGAESADLVVKGVTLVNVCTKELLPDIDVAVADGRIAMVGNCDHCVGKDTVVFDGRGKYLAPAFMDGHIHIESSMLTASEYARAVLPHGTSAIMMDPHEICNVLGLPGVRYMLDDAKRTPLKIMLTVPSCVPAVPGFEDTGAEIGPQDIAEVMTWRECVGLGEMMNFPGILSSDEKAHAIVGETHKAGKIVTGHYSVPETERGLNAYLSSGVRNCHESTRMIDALEKMRRGMYAQFREGSAWHDLQEVSKAITENKVDSRFACLVSDDAHPDTLIKSGHMDHIIRRAIGFGIDPLTAIQMATINVAQCYQLDHEMGSISPSKCADMVLLSDLENCVVTEVFIDGELVAKDGKTIKNWEPYRYPEEAQKTVRLQKKRKEDFVIKAPEKRKNADSVKVRAIEVISAKTSTKETFVTLPVVDEKISLGNEDVMKAFVFERHKNTGRVGMGFVKGFGIKRGALAQTVAHDAHNLLVVGTDDEDMALATNELIECGGGLIAVADGMILGKVPLPIAGLISDEDLHSTAEKVSRLERAWAAMGSALPSPFMTMSIISLACLPELRLTDRGLVDCRTFSFVDAIVE